MSLSSQNMNIFKINKPNSPKLYDGTYLTPLNFLAHEHSGASTLNTNGNSGVIVHSSASFYFFHLFNNPIFK